MTSDPVTGGPDPRPRAPGPGPATGAPAPVPRGTGAPEPSALPFAGEWFRAHPISPLVYGWKAIVGIWAVVTVQNINTLIENFSIVRGLIGLAALAVLALLVIAVAYLAWRVTRYRVTERAIEARSGIFVKSEKTAPLDRVESLDIERPLVARLLGLSAVKIEVAGGENSKIAIAYLSGSHAEELRRDLLELVWRRKRGAVAGTAPAAASVVSPAGTATGSAPGTVPGSAPGTAPGTVADPAAGAPAAPGPAGAGAGRPEAFAELLYDGVTDGVLLARIPTARLLRSMARDLGLWMGVVVTLAAVVPGAIFTVQSDGITIASLFFLVPLVFVVPSILFKQLESGWGFVSRITPTGIRLRRGLLNTSGNNIVPDRVQALRITQPLLWRGPGWVRLEAAVAGYGPLESLTGDTGKVLPVGTRDELLRTLAHLLPDLEVPDAAAWLDVALTGRRDDGGFVPVPERAKVFDPFAWRRRGVVLTPSALLIRGGVVARTLVIVPLDRPQSVELSAGPWDRRRELATVSVAVAGGMGLDASAAHLDAADAETLLAAVAARAATARRYDEREAWSTPAVSLEETLRDAARDRGAGTAGETDTGPAGDTDGDTDADPAEGTTGDAAGYTAAGETADTDAAASAPPGADGPRYR